MIINCFQISRELQLIPHDYESAVNAMQQPDTCVWIDMQGLNAGELENELDKLAINGLSKKLCLEAHDRPGFYPMNKMTFLVVPVLVAAEDESEVRHVAFLARPNFLLTLRDTRAGRLQNAMTMQESSDWLPNNSVAGLISAFTILLSLESLKRASDLRDMIMTLEKALDRKPDSVEMKDISHKRSELLTLESVVSGQMPILKALIADKRPTLQVESIQEYLSCALANLQATDRSLHWLEGRIDVMRSLVDSRSQDKMNRRLARLTILSAIFMPMTFLAGIWGMNFEGMPGLRNPSGYQFALSFMFLIGVGMYFYFRKKGWFE